MTPTDTPAIAAEPLPAGARVAAALRHPGNWLQLVKFGLVGSSGFAVNTAVYWLLLRRAHIHYLPAAALAFCVAVLNNFVWNHGWTFRHTRGDSHAAFQAARFFVVSLMAFLCSAGLLVLLVEHFGVGKVPAQVGAVTLVMPISFLANRLWSFR
jgi:putative flippase GtrA